MTIFLGIISAIIVISYVIDFKNNRMSTKEMVMASLIAASSIESMSMPNKSLNVNSLLCNFFATKAYIT